MSSNWVPEILYEEVDEGSSSIPFIMVPKDEDMPKLLYIFESSETGEFEPGTDGEDLPVVQWDLHQYADMVVLKDSLDHVTYDLVRAALGLDPLEAASKKGIEITSRVRENIES